MNISTYNQIRSGEAGFFEQKRGLIAVSGKDAVPFLDGMISNDMKTLEDGQQMLAAFPNAQGRLLAVVRVLREGDRFLIETEEATREKVFNNLFRFTYAGDFFVEDLSEKYRYFELFGNFGLDSDEENSRESDATFLNSPPYEGGVAAFRGRGGSLGVFIEGDAIPDGLAIDDETYETLRIESGIPKYGVDMDETTIVPELGLDGLISYNKGCYIGQEIIARIHFRGHVAKRLTGLIIDSDTGLSADAGGTPAVKSMELTSLDGKPAGRSTSLTYSPKLEKTIGLAYVRYDYLAEGTELMASDLPTIVKDLPLII
ncbi:MAG: glycine cleavage T C-terminal barrel domain-containing protein [Pyrinomonadaceae bacterium]